MNLSKLFELQRQLDEHIVKEKGLEGQNLLDKKILALQVELGELANEWRGFKYWSNDQKPRRTVYEICKYCEGRQTLGFQQESCWYCGGTGLQVVKRPLLEEYVDCLHFILSIGFDLKTINVVIDSDYTGINATETFIIAFETTTELANAIREGNKPYIYQVYEELFNLFVGLGEKYLGFTWEQIEQAYIEKNKINHERQNNSY